ncbi:hypothetical protein NLI96_g10825 [Meripilus lineatus]|uniref:Uncharacterized protein n=1 Tax=Meripilus lineatus TaxID=2056292 RepID=A0AAD5UVA4_9APHY|nr:hypothetical protein NLI96_g10825 [Physisporinus lineatus]
MDQELPSFQPVPSAVSKGPYQSISVTPQIGSLLGLFELPDFLSVSSLASDVLSSMKMSPSFSTGEPSPSALELLNNIQSADPHPDLYSEDDHGASWGHAQYTSGSLTLTTVLLSWASLGSVDTALRFIAAGAQTVKMAKHICFVDNLPDSSPLALRYLQNTLELIWSHWKAAGGPVFKGKSSASLTPLSSSPSTPSSTNPSSVSQVAQEELKILLTKLTKSQLLTWIQDKKIGCKNKNIKKDDLANIIVAASSDLHPTEEDINTLLERPSKRKRV